MARKKVKLSLIANESVRKTTFKKRKNGLMKKISELSTLCGVTTCMIIFGPYEQKADVWPHCPRDAQRVLARFKSLPEMEQSKKMMNHEGYLRQRIAKLKEQLKRQQKENRSYEITQLMYQSLAGMSSHHLSMDDLGDLAWFIDEKMKAIREKVELIKRAPPEEGTLLDDRRISGVGGEGDNTALDATIEALQWQPWFVEAMNPNEPIAAPGDEMVVPYVDHYSWPCAPFP